MKKKIILLMLSIILVLVILGSTTYALFFKQDKLEHVESYTSGILDIVVDNSEEGLGEVLTLASSLPLSDSEGKNSKAYKFKITNNGNLAYTFDLKLLSTSTNNMISSNYIKVMVNNSEPVLLSSLTDSIIESNITLNPNQSKIISVRVWLDENTPNTEIGKTFSAKLVSDGIASEVNENELNLDISVANIEISQVSDKNLLLVSGGGLVEDVEIDPTTPIIITGNTNTNNITVSSGTANIILDNINIVGTGTLYEGTLKLLDNTNVTLTLVGENTLDASEGIFILSSGAGIFVKESSILTINGKGILNVIGRNSGIGTGYNAKAGTIIINSGNINASSTYKGAGIGGGDLVKIEINGGNIKAIGGPGELYNNVDYHEGGAGIGGVYAASITGEIIINGGIVYAKGQSGGAGIGGGGPTLDTFEVATAPNITISPNAIVTAIGGGLGAQDIGNGGIG